MIPQYNIQKLNLLLESFYTLTKIKIVIFDNHLTKIAEYPKHECKFCSLIRSNPSALLKCMESDRVACENSYLQNRTYSYACHAGLSETVTPIHCGNVIIGYIMFGQILQNTDEENHWETVRMLCEPYSIPEDDLRAAYFSKRPMKNKQIDAAIHLMEICAKHLWMERATFLQVNSLAEQIDEYISNNLHNDLATAKLCEHFNISRSSLYRISNDLYGVGIERVTTLMRIEKAKDLLTETEMPISEISACVGYSDYNYFIRVFRKVIGCPPAKYKKSLSEK